jgi:hypothetical protein
MQQRASPLVRAGYDTWLDDRWSLSVSARVLIAPFAVTENSDTDVTVFTPSVLVDIGYL